MVVILAKSEYQLKITFRDPRTGGEPPARVHKNHTGQGAGRSFSNVSNCREIIQLKRVAPHELTYVTVAKEARENCK